MIYNEIDTISIPRNSMTRLVKLIHHCPAKDEYQYSEVITPVLRFVFIEIAGERKEQCSRTNQDCIECHGKMIDLQHMGHIDASKDDRRPSANPYS